MSSNTFFNKESIKNEILTKDNKAVEYIIFQNNSILTELIEKNSRIKELESERDDFEEEVDSLTRSRTCLQGISKNYNELFEMEKKKNIMIYNGFILFSLYALGMSTIYSIAMTTSSVLGKYDVQFKCIFTMVIFTSNIVYYIKLFNSYIRNTKLNEAIKKLKNANKNIDELIDNM